MNLVGVIALMSSIHYFYAKNLWVLNGQAPTALRYIDWLLTFPLTILTFYVMLKSVTDVKRGMFWRLLVGTLVWVIAQLLGAYGYMSVTLGFLVGIVGWLYIIGELYMGDTGRKNASCGNENVQMAFFANRLIITIGFSIYHIGYFIEHLAGGANINSLNVIYNLADFLNKIIFGMIIYSAALQIQGKDLELRRNIYDKRSRYNSSNNFIGTCNSNYSLFIALAIQKIFKRSFFCENRNAWRKSCYIGRSICLTYNS